MFKFAISTRKFLGGNKKSFLLFFALTKFSGFLFSEIDRFSFLKFRDEFNKPKNIVKNGKRVEPSSASKHTREG